MSKRRLVRLCLGLLILLTIAVVYITQKSDSPEPAAKTPSSKSDKPAVKPVPFSKTLNSLTDPNSIWVVVNKVRPLQPQNYAPGDLVVPNLPKRAANTQVRQVMIPSLEQLFAAAQQNGTPLRISSGYRSYVYQVGLYNGYVRTQGQAVADTQSARPGYSEHQTGLAVDVSPQAGNCEVQVCFATTPAGQWLAANAYKYGFLIRYADGQKAITGYDYEPWHLRYIGVELAAELKKANMLTLEQFFELGAAPDYAPQ